MPPMEYENFTPSDWLDYFNQLSDAYRENFMECVE